MTEKFLDKVYGTHGTKATRDLYDAWSQSYEAEVREHGYATPARVAEALHALAPDPAEPILDFGCGTGLSGLALKLAGFQTIDGADLSADMLSEARSKGIYRQLWQVDPDSTPPYAPGDYRIITAIGVIGAGAAPAATLDRLIELLPKGGLLAFSFNDHTLEDPAYEAHLNAWIDKGAARLLFHDHGDHLPGIGLKSMVYVVEKL